MKTVKNLITLALCTLLLAACGAPQQQRDEVTQLYHQLAAEYDNGMQLLEELEQQDTAPPGTRAAFQLIKTQLDSLSTQAEKQFAGVKEAELVQMQDGMAQALAALQATSTELQAIKDTPLPTEQPVMGGGPWSGSKLMTVYEKTDQMADLVEEINLLLLDIDVPDSLLAEYVQLARDMTAFGLDYINKALLLDDEMMDEAIEELDNFLAQLTDIRNRILARPLG